MTYALIVALLSRIVVHSTTCPGSHGRQITAFIYSGFRLDAFGSVQSSVTVTNVALGFAGIRDPFSLSLIGRGNNGQPVLQLTGPLGFNYRVETSTNLVDWATMVILVNANGIVRFIDSSTNTVTSRFYRAVAP